MCLCVSAPCQDTGRGSTPRHGPRLPNSLSLRRWSQAETTPLFPSLASRDSSSPPSGCGSLVQQLSARCNPLPHVRYYRPACLTRCENPSTVSLHDGLARHAVRHCPISSQPTQGAEDRERGVRQKWPVWSVCSACRVVW